jgi:hypothetical protein
MQNSGSSGGTNGWGNRVPLRKASMCSGSAKFTSSVFSLRSRYNWYQSGKAGTV